VTDAIYSTKPSIFPLIKSELGSGCSLKLISHHEVFGRGLCIGLGVGYSQLSPSRPIGFNRSVDKSNYCQDWRTPKDNRTFGDFERTYCLIAQQNFEMSQAKFWRKSLSTMSIKTLAEDFQLGIHLEIIWMLLDFKVNSI
jgi:hypothetical protein